MIEVGTAERAARDVAVGAARELPQQVGVLPLRDTVTFPDMLIPLNVGQPRSVELINEVLRGDRSIAMVASRNTQAETPSPDDLYDVGVLGAVARMIRVPDGTLRVLIQGGQRIRIDRWVRTEPYLVAEIAEAPDVVDHDPRADRADAQRPAHVHGHHRAGPVPARGAPDHGRQRRRPERAGASDRRRAADPDRGEAGAARGARRGQAPQKALGDPGPRARGGGDRLEDPVPGPVRARQGSARVLPAPAAQGDPGGARRGRRDPGRGQRAARAARRDRAARGRPQAGRARAGPARAPAAGDGRVRRRPRVPRVDRGAAVGQDHRGQPRPRARPHGPRRGPLRHRAGQGADPRVPRR